VESDLVKTLTPASPAFQATLSRVAASLVEVPPQLIPDGCGGSYFLSEVVKKRCFTAKENKFVWKPEEEEAGADGNPKGNFQTMRATVPTSGGAKREVAAFMLAGSARVPETVLAQWCGRIGSLQQFIRSESDGECMAKVLQIPSAEVHRLGLLDLRLVNLDRNESNVKVTKVDGEYVPIPIDHGLILPTDLSEMLPKQLCWLAWPQAAVPFDKAILHEIKQLSSARDSFVLKSLGFEDCLVQLNAVVTAVIQEGAAKGLNLSQIAGIICRTEAAVPSIIEMTGFDVASAVAQVAN